MILIALLVPFTLAGLLFALDAWENFLFPPSTPSQTGHTED
ncbi:hypothetical protein [Streptomyces levis]